MADAPSVRCTYPRASLLGLPVELRMRIYDCLLSSRELSLKLRHRMTWRGHTIRNAWAMVHVCRVIRNEIFKPFYSCITWEFQDGFTEQKMRLWADAIGHDAVSLLRHLRFFCSGPCNNNGFYPFDEEKEYCRRQATIDLVQDREHPGKFVLDHVDGMACSNDVARCAGMTGVVAAHACRWLVDGVTAEALVGIWQSLIMDNRRAPFED